VKNPFTKKTGDSYLPHSRHRSEKKLGRAKGGNRARLFQGGFLKERGNTALGLWVQRGGGGPEGLVERVRFHL